MSATSLDLDREKNSARKRSHGCGFAACSEPTFAYIALAVQRSGDRVQVGSANGRFCREHTEVIFEQMAPVLEWKP